MTIHRYEVTDAEWAIIEPMLPKHHMGRPQKDLRAHFNGILWIARSGARWEDLPARYGQENDEAGRLYWTDPWRKEHKDSRPGQSGGNTCLLVDICW